jgi:hypothetical protein
MAGMNFTFSSSQHGTCIVKLWATGRHGFSLPKRVDIATPDGAVRTYLYYNRKVQLKPELANRAIVRIAVACFHAGIGGRCRGHGGSRGRDAGLRRHPDADPHQHAARAAAGQARTFAWTHEAGIADRRADCEMA